MGLDTVVRHASDVTPNWPVIRGHLIAAGESPVLRMIDGQLALPDEAPPAEWRELRVSLAGGMVTLRRGPGTLTCVSWGTGDPALDAARARLAAACAAATGGTGG